MMRSFVEVGILPSQVAELTIPQILMLTESDDGDKKPATSRRDVKHFTGRREYEEWRREKFGGV